MPRGPDEREGYCARHSRRSADRTALYSAISEDCFVKHFMRSDMPKQGSRTLSFRITFHVPFVGRCAGSTIRNRMPKGNWSWCWKARSMMSSWTSERDLPPSGSGRGLNLSADNSRQLYVPPGCAHGFCVTSDQAAVLYKCTEFYSPKDERGIIWNDPGSRHLVAGARPRCSRRRTKRTGPWQRRKPNCLSIGHRPVDPARSTGLSYSARKNAGRCVLRSMLHIPS